MRLCVGYACYIGSRVHDAPLIAEGLVKRFGEVLAVRDVGIRVRAGEVVGLLGPNGAGKTTILRMLAGILGPTEGRVWITGQDLRQFSLEAKRRIGFLSGDTQLYNRLTAREVLEYFGVLYGMDQDRLSRRVQELIEELEISSFASRPCGTLSSGQKQRANIARAFLHEPAASFARGLAPGGLVTIFGTGISSGISGVVATGALGPLPPALIVLPVVVGIAGAVCEVLFSGYAPGFMGLYQINFRIPPDSVSGSSLNLDVRVGDVYSQTASLAVDWQLTNSQDSLVARVNGQGVAANNFQIEGIDNNVENNDLTGIVPPVESIQTVDVSTTNYDAEFGRAGGAVVNVTIRSGTNDLHGFLFQFHKNENIQAFDVFATFKPPTVYNQFGGLLSGPIQRDKTFFFADYQGSRDHKGGNNLVTIPNAPFRIGDFRGAPSIIHDPLTGDTAGRGRTPFPNQQIPAGRISPVSRNLLALMDMPTRAGDVTNFEGHCPR